MTLGIEMIKAALPRVSAENIDHFGSCLITAMQEFEICEPVEEAMFLSQVMVESQNLTRVSENLNYKASGLLRVFRRYFDEATAVTYAHNPEAIANRAYANRMGNGDESSGDGWRHRGMGLIQITGKDNQTRCLEALGRDPQDVDYLQSAEGAARSACWFWSENDVGRFAAVGDFDGACDMINIGHKTKVQGDAIGYEERLKAYNHIRQALGV